MMLEVAGCIPMFLTPTGTYDYHCDPHANLGMVGQIVVGDETICVDTFMLTADFLFMGPNVGQTFWLAIIDKETGEIVNQVKTTASNSVYT